MSDSSRDRVTDEQLELYLDDQLSQEDRAKIEEALRTNTDAAGIAALQKEIDSNLRRSFSPPSATSDQIVKLLADDSNESRQTLAKRSRVRQVLVATFAIAASILIFLVWRGSGPVDVKPFFEPRSVVAIYRETVDQGFRPYYFCEDPERFAMTFAKRQKTPLVLGDLPADRRMVGLSYPGGMSRDTTAILCYANETPVVVFVDRLKHDSELITAANPGTGVHVHRAELGDLVMYEVSPLPQPKFTDFLTVKTPN